MGLSFLQHKSTIIVHLIWTEGVKTMKKMKMLGTLSAVALTLGTAGCGVGNSTTPSPTKTSDSESVSQVKKECKDMELVSGKAYSGDKDEVWYCNDDDTTGSSTHSGGGMFFYPMMGGYYNGSTMKSKHNVDVSNYKPGTAKTKVSTNQYNKAAKVKLPASKRPVSSTTHAKPSTGSKSSTFSSSKPSKSSTSSKISSSSSSKGFGSSFSSSGG